MNKSIIRLKTVLVFMIPFFLVGVICSQSAPGEIIVEFEGTNEARNFISTMDQLRSYGSMEVVDEIDGFIFLLKTDEKDRDEWIERLSADKRVKSAQPNRMAHHRGFTPNDPRYVDQWNLDQVGAGRTQWSWW